MMVAPVMPWLAFIVPATSSVCAGLWVLFAVPTLLWWRDSVALVLAISIYANVVGHLSAVEAARPPEDPL